MIAWPCRSVLLIVLLFSLQASGQRVTLTDTTNPVAGGDTGVPAGTIHIRRTPVEPYFKVQYRLVPAKMVEGEARDASGLLVNNYVQYPQKDWNYSDILAKSVKYVYAVKDTPHIDTVRMDILLTTGGRTRMFYFDSAGCPKTIPSELYEQIKAAISTSKNNAWTPGGYRVVKRFGGAGASSISRRGPLRKTMYFCYTTVIVASYPLSKDEKKTGIRHTADENLTTNETETSSASGVPRRPYEFVEGKVKAKGQQ